MDAIINAFGMVMTFEVLAVMVVAAIYGLFVGAIPGLTATMAVALMVPVTFFMDPVPAISAIVTMAAMAIFAGDLPAVYMRMPGTPASAAYTEPCYSLAQRGLGEYALSMSAVSSAIGGSIGVLALILFAPFLAEFALNFSSFEYFWLACMGLTAAIAVSDSSPVKGAVSLLLGLLVASVGLDPVSGEARFTFGNADLLGGLGFIPVIIGLFAVAEILRFCTRNSRVGNSRQAALVPQKPMLLQALRDIFKYKAGVAQGSFVGVLIGILPGAGADVAAYISYAMSKRAAAKRTTPDEVNMAKIVPATAANNAAVGGSFIPATVFGIPGDSLTAIVIGVLFMKGLNPGPTIFTENADMINAVFLAFLLANILLVPFGFLAIKLFKRVLQVPQSILMPVILAFSIVGAFAVENTLFAIAIILAFGIIGFFMEENGFPLAPMILGIVLGPMLEETFITSMMRAQGDLMVFFERPVSLTLAIITLSLWMLPLLLRVLKRRAGIPPQSPAHRKEECTQ
ncbi:tripartite tricarboxylate transporter permease [Pseudomonas sp. MM211]|uniref:tripartite tricarboxylate transporter permease n=1 Tax=Pseudomonas sp. MM211 TaxID=2866808 RepID=UPI001CEC513A|nr:tripartite tricarboxylate transporter permease [Pseudomonas sp. MM211]UCJ18058.1 tripartite tricarboxylate transporter permease [Pseudomonas sp. MM211]